MDRAHEALQIDAVKRLLADLRDPAARPRALAVLKQFPREHPIETALGAGSVLLVLVTLWLIGSALLSGGGPAVAQYAFFEVDCTPPANVRINGKDHGRTPRRVEVAPGKVDLEVYDETLGFRRTDSFSVYLGNNPDRRYEIGHGTVEFKVFPGGTVYLNGRKLGEAPVPPSIVYEGKHAVRIENAKFDEELVFELEVKAGDKTTVQKSFLKL